jgi:6-phosphogluconolactonase (cycloisomerase 2 family)
MPESRGTLLAIGGYTPDDAPAGDGAAGLSTWWWDGGTSVVPAGSADLPSPSFACWHPTLPVLYAVSELDIGMVTALAVSADGALTPVASAPTGGSQPCGVTVDPTGRTALIANYGSGSAAMVALDERGTPIGDPVVMQHHGSGPVAERQGGPHVHQLVPTERGTVLASDLGTDRIVEYRIDAPTGSTSPARQVIEMGSIAMPAGSGPRHIALATGGWTGPDSRGGAGGVLGYVTGELDGTVTTIRRERRRNEAGPSPRSGRPAERSAERTIGHRERRRSEAGPSPRSGRPAERSAERTIGHPAGDRWTVTDQVRCSGRPGAQPSHLDLAGDGRWLLVANRGPDTIAVLDVAAGLRIRHEVPTGATPRHFAVAGDRVLVACQGSDEVDVLALDAVDGALTRVGPLSAPGRGRPWRTPSCVALRPRPSSS